MKRILCLLLTLAVLTALTCHIFAADTLSTTHLPEGSLTFATDGNTLTVSGSILCDRLEKIRLAVGEEERFITAGSGKKISETFSISAEGSVPVTVYTKKAGEDLYWSYIWQTITVEKTADGYRITDTAVYDHNQTLLNNTWFDPDTFLCSTVDPAVAAKAAQIAGSEKDPYRQLLALHRWTAENLYYDNDYIAGKTETTPTAPADVLTAGYAVCEGYANLLQAFCQALDIPCMIVYSYSTGTGTDGFLSTEDNSDASLPVNHAHAAAWVKGRLIHMDPTWDSPNRYEEGQKYKGVSSGYMYFDTTLEYLSRSHKILGFSAPSAQTAPEDVPSDWAAAEVRAALSAEIVPADLQGNYRAPITRAGFCSLLMTMLQRRLGYASLDELLAGRNMQIDETVFTDTANLSLFREIAAAYGLGIVNGRGDGIFDPASGITRQEAAAMLMRAAQVLEIPMGENPKSFKDMAEADTWAAMGILFVSSLRTPAGQAVMNGVSDTSFAPQSSYTTEQAILTMIRLFQVQ